jgi:hypothetical protein
MDRTFQKNLEGARFHRLLQEPECLEVMDGGKRLFHTAESGERDRRCEVAAFLQLLEQFETVHPRHHQIRHDDVCTEAGEPLQRFLPVGGDLNIKVTIGDHASQGGTLTLVVIDDEDPARNRSLLEHCLYSSKPQPKGGPQFEWLIRVTSSLLRGINGARVQAPGETHQLIAQLYSW